MGAFLFGAQMTQKQLEKGIMAVVIAFIVAIVLLSSAHAQTTNYLFPQPKMQFFDANGNPLNGGKVYTYAAGTSTPLVTCQDSTCSAINTNPVILDSGGYGSIWLSTAGYKLNLKTSADVNVWTVDNVSAGCPLIGCSMTGQLSVHTPTATAIVAQSDLSGAITATANAAAAIALQANTSGSGTQVSVKGIANNASGIAIQAVNLNASGQLYSGLNSAGVEKFSVANTGCMSIAGGTCLATTNQTGTSNIVLSTAPQIDSPQFTTQITVGASGTAIKKIISATSALDFPNIPANTTATLNITGITGVVAGDGCQVMPLGAPESGLVWSCFTGTDLITVVVGNVTTGAIDPASRTWRGTGSKF
jgi:hypothetical protein